MLFLLLNVRGYIYYQYCLNLVLHSWVNLFSKVSGGLLEFDAFYFGEYFTTISLTVSLERSCFDDYCYWMFRIEIFIRFFDDKLHKSLKWHVLFLWLFFLWIKVTLTDFFIHLFVSNIFPFLSFLFKPVSSVTDPSAERLNHVYLRRSITMNM